MTPTDAIDDVTSEDEPVPPRRRRWKWIISGVVVLAVVGALTPVAAARLTGLPSDAVVRVGDTTVTEADLAKRLDVLEALYGVKAPTKAKQLDQFNRDAAKSQAVSLILDQAARKRDVVISDKVASVTLTRLIDEQMPGGRAAFEEFLGASRISETSVLDEVKRQLATTRLVEKVAGSGKKVTVADAQTYYDRRKDDMVSRERRQLHNVVVETRSEADAVVRQARRGTSFTVLAAKYSRDASTRDKGGDLGTLTAEQLEPAFAKAAFSARKGEVFGPVKTRFGWNVGEVAAVSRSRALGFDEVKEGLVAELQNRQVLTAWRAWLAKELKSAGAEYADDYRPADPDAAPAGLPE